MRALNLLFLGLVFSVSCAYSQRTNLSAISAFDKISYYWTDEKSSLNCNTSYPLDPEFLSAATDVEIMERKVFQNVGAIIEFTVLKNDESKKAFKDVSVYFTNTCEDCEMSVKFSQEQIYNEGGFSSILMAFIMKRQVAGKEINTEIKIATLGADGSFDLRPNNP